MHDVRFQRRGCWLCQLYLDARLVLVRLGPDHRRRRRRHRRRAGALRRVYKTPVKGFDFSTDSFDLASVQELYQQYRAVPGPTEDEGPSEDKLAAKARLSAAYLRAYYPTIEGM